MDEVTTIDEPVPIQLGSTRRATSRPPSAPRPALEGVLIPFAGEDDARAALALVRVALLPYVATAAMADALLTVLCAKALDETTGSTIDFVAVPGKVDRAGRAFARCIERTFAWLRKVTGEDDWPALAVSPEAAYRILDALGPFSIMLTAAAPQGRRALEALFAEVLVGDETLGPSSVFGRPEVARELLDQAAFKTRSSRVRTATVAALDAYGERGRLKARNLDWMRGNYKRGDTELNNFPKLIHVELSTICNLRCRTCSITRPGRERDLGYISLETLERLRPALAFVSDCKLHGGGEPFMHPQIEQVIQVFRDEGVRLNTVTNAVLIRERLAKLIGETFSSLTVSVDGGDRETYEYVRLKASWDKLLRGLDLINTHRSQDLRLIIGVVMLKCNIHQLPDLVRFAHAHGAQELQAAWLVPFHDLPWTATQRLTDDPARTNSFMDEARAVGDELGISVRIPDNLPLDPGAPAAGSAGLHPDHDAVDEEAFHALALEKVVHLNERGADRAGDEASTIVAIEHADTYWDLHGTNRVEGHCRLMYDRAMILQDGRVKPCGQSRMVPSLGSVHDQSFERCWNSAGYQDLRATFNGGTLPRTCQSCNFIRSKQLGTARLVYD